MIFYPATHKLKKMMNYSQKLKVMQNKKRLPHLPLVMLSCGILAGVSCIKAREALSPVADKPVAPAAGGRLCSSLERQDWPDDRGSRSERPLFRQCALL